MSARRGSPMSLAITGIGMVSPLGLDAATSCAAARAGLIRAAPLDSFKVYSKGAWGNVGIVGHALQEFAGGFEGFGKLVRLGGAALNDLLRGAQFQTQDWSRTALCVALPSGYLQSQRERDPQFSMDEEDSVQTFLQTLAEGLPARICEVASLAIPAAQRALIFEDQAGFARGLLHAWQLISTGQVDRCILGGVDACTDGRHLAAAHHFNAVKTEDQPCGFQPGEAAGFLMLEPVSAALAQGVPIAGEIAAAAIDHDTVGRCDRGPPLGVGLAEAIDHCLAIAPEGTGAAGWIIADLNGDAFRGNDWGYALVRLMAAHPCLGSCPLVIPAESFGETGAAQGAIASCMAVRAFARGYAPAPRALVWLASYGGDRGAFVIDSRH